MTPFAAFDRIRIINLASRPDRRREMQGELARVGLGDDPRVGFFDAVASDSASPWRAKGERGVFLSHLAILQEAAKSGESVLILEDDADFTPALADLHVDPGTQIFYGGYDATSPGPLVDSDIVGAHCMGFSRDIVPLLVAFLEPLQAHHSPPPIDGAYVWYRRAHPETRTQFAEPVVAVQRPSRSDIAHPKQIDRIPVLRALAPVARRAKRSILRGEISFGLREAIMLAAAGVAIAVAVALHHL
ncbi:glycosyltransferase family 25 protein [Sphingomonas rhizophila]|uniref:Glycosyltransferase family 25 protein n=1 Tax=Sphingomonas rhizophila TaxID=2071607 RepID=A0A7G9SBU5_9SPHN|nr:glycosyltransferase family 25 protein [Sphingomonas rhizophila]QNN65320.1 glycosyltransferase family 25 protein [Sphingomonas rhizophila]